MRSHGSCILHWEQIYFEFETFFRQRFFLPEFNYLFWQVKKVTKLNLNELENATNAKTKQQSALQMTSRSYGCHLLVMRLMIFLFGRSKAAEFVRARYNEILVRTTENSQSSRTRRHIRFRLTPSVLTTFFSAAASTSVSCWMTKVLFRVQRAALPIGLCYGQSTSG